MKKSISMGLVFCLILSLYGCQTWSRRAKGAAIGAGAGGLFGGIIGKQSGNTVVGVLLGAAVGGAAGAWIGHYMDKQAAEIERDLQGARVERVGEGIKITFDSALLFDVDKADLKTASRSDLTGLAGILNKYPDTNILLEGHTDATGSDEYNLNLSRLRSQSVSNHLAGQGVNATRFSIMGYGESQPIADNDTVTGRQLNRRVEVAIYANDKLKRIASSRTAQY